jgi:hypothetical protein
MDNKPERLKGRYNLLYLFAGVLLLAALLFLVGNFASPSDGNVQQDRDSAADGYYDEYERSVAVYERILGMSDCTELQNEFDTAADNNDRAEPGTSQHRQTLGYMTAADDRLEAAGCYD